MSEVRVLPGGVPVPDVYMVTTDQATILGNGTFENPLRAVSSFVQGVDLQDEGVPVAGNPHQTINFVGAGVTTTDVGGVGTVTVPGGITLQDEGVPVAGNPHQTINFVGAGVTTTDVGGVGTVTVPGGIALQDEGVPVAGNPHQTINFVGAGVTTTDVGGVGTVTVPGGIAGIVVEEEGSSLGTFTTLNFAGTAITATNAGGGVALATVTDAVAVSVVSVANVVLTTAAGQVARVNPTGGGFSVTLPAAASHAGQSVVVKNVSHSVNAITVLPGGGDTVDGDASYLLSGDRFFCRFTSDGVSDWMATGA